LPSKEPVKINGSTVGLCFGISNEYHGRGDYNIETVDDVEVAAKGIKEDFVEIALPYYDKMHDLNAVERYLNKKNVDGTYRPTTVSAACMGLIAAHLCGRTDFKELAEFYYNYHYNFPYNFPTPQKRQSLSAPILSVMKYFEKSAQDTERTLVRGLLPCGKSSA
jgi:hypothetical protein